MSSSIKELLLLWYIVDFLSVFPYVYLFVCIFICPDRCPYLPIAPPRCYGQLFLVFWEVRQQLDKTKKGLSGGLYVDSTPFIVRLYL